MIKSEDAADGKEFMVYNEHSDANAAFDFVCNICNTELVVQGTH